MTRATVRESKGFSLIELLVAVSVVGVLISIAYPLFENFMKKAKTVEGEVALNEIRSLENQYYFANLIYSDDLPTLGWRPDAPLKYYTITIQLNGPGPPPFFYQAIATANLDNDPDLDAWVLTQWTDGTSDIQHGCIPGGVGTVQLNCAD